MKNKEKTKEQLINELSELRQRISYLEILEEKYKEIEKKLHINEERFRDISENANEWIWEVDKDGKYTYVSPVVEKILGYKKDEILKKHFYDLFHPEDRKKLKKAAFEKFAQKKPFREFINRNMHKEGVVVWLSTSGVPILDEEGYLLGYRGADTDITERKLMEDALKDSEKKYRDLVDNAIVGVYKTNIKGDILYVNKALASMFEYETPEESKLGGVISKYKDPKDREILIKKLYKKGKVNNFEIKMITKTGKNKNILLNAILNGDTISGMILDITERKQTEKKLKMYTEELQRSNRELEQFAFVVSHELRDPMVSLASSLKLLKRKNKGGLDLDSDVLINSAEERIKQVQTLLSDLLVYSRFGSSRKKLKPTDCMSVFNQTIENLNVSIEETGAVITHDYLPEVIGDAIQLSQLFQNLLNNAIKFCDKKPPRIHISAERKGKEWVFSVSDNGIGIPQEHIGRIFEIFKRLHGIGVYSGSGIGLSICKKIVENHGGRLWVESEPSKGSTFYFTVLDGKFLNDLSR